MTAVYAIYHLNLAYSAIAPAERGAVVERCYDPLLDLVEDAGLPLGIELTGWTLETLQALRPDWVARLRGLLETGRCELIGSGYTQLIGPLVPAQVNRWNQRLGLETYQSLLGIRPGLALVNEMAWSGGLVDHYRDAGYRGLVMDQDNVRLALGLRHYDSQAMPTHALDGEGDGLPVLWSDSILFQRLQRAVHGDISRDDYLDYLRSRLDNGDAVLALYCNDAEVFDYRPGRYATEARLHGDGEWRRLRGLHEAVREAGVTWMTPSAALDHGLARREAQPRRLTSVLEPVPVKKQAKYNLSRWAVTGRDDLWLNSRCHRLYRALASHPDGERKDARQSLCRLWASDLRTHTHDESWRAAMTEFDALASRLGLADGEAAGVEPQWHADPPRDDLFGIESLNEGLLLRVETRHIRLVLNLRRGLAIDSLAFAGHDLVPVVGTLAHGWFHSIELGADFYTGGTVIELPAEHRRLTDLERVAPAFAREGDVLLIRAGLETDLGTLVKTLRVSLTDESVCIGYAFPGWQRPQGSLRVGHITLLPDAFSGPLTLECANGGDTERLAVDRPCHHGLPASTLVSCRTGLGATDGRLRLGDGERGIVMEWDPARCAALPLLTHHPCPPAALTRVAFSLVELDETLQPGGRLCDFEVRLRPG